MASRKIKLRDLSRIQPEFQEAMDVSNALGKEAHPIATAILGAVMVELELGTLLRSKFQRKDDKTWEMLVADNGPLNSFYSMIITGYALGIYDERMRNDLNILRNIRNAFAHSKRLLHFDNPLIVKELEKASYLSKEFWNLAKVEPVQGAAEFSTRYVVLCNWLATKLVGIDRSPRQDKSKRYPHQRRAISPLALAALFTPPPGGKDK